MIYRQLTPAERMGILILRQWDFSVSQIALVLDRHRSTIYREIERNSVFSSKGPSYRFDRAQELCDGRRRRTRRGPHHGEEAYARICSLLGQQYSPEQIAGLLRLTGELSISHQTIYRYIRRNWKAGGCLWQALRQRYKRRKRTPGTERRGRLQGKPMIEERPAEVALRQQVGHWEGDTLHGASIDGHSMVTLVERVSGMVLIEPVSDRKSQTVTQALRQMIQRSHLPVHSITLDNGTEFHGYRQVMASTGVAVYLANPHHPWERGTNENTNGLLRQYWPKRRSMKGIGIKKCRAVEHALNSRPRKRHGYLSPIQYAEKLSHL